MSPEPLAIQVRVTHSELMTQELESIALRLFEEHGFRNVTVEQIASTAGISPRTFYRYFPTKEDVFQARIDRRTNALRTALAARPDDEPPLRSVRLALVEQFGTEDPDVVRRWVAVITSSPPVLPSVLGGLQLKAQRLVADFLAGRLGQPADAVVPTMLAAATSGVIQAAHVDWYRNGGDLATKISHGLEVLEHNALADRNPGRRRAPHEEAHLEAVRARIQRLEVELHAVAELLVAPRTDL